MDEDDTNLTVIFSFSLVASCIAAYMTYIYPMNVITRYEFNHKWFEGDFRWTHSRVVTHGESIALYEGEAKERDTAERGFANVYAISKKLYMFQTLLEVRAPSPPPPPPSPKVTQLIQHCTPLWEGGGGQLYRRRGRGETPPSKYEPSLAPKFRLMTPAFSSFLTPLPLIGG
jgi:hypothetical protein